MSYIPITPFRRAVDASVLDHQQYASGELSSHTISKWDVLRELSTARKRFGLTDRELTVLQVLLSFYPETELSTDSEALVVFPSNAAICERLNGMACSTMRRQLSRLVQTGFVIRRDSPNGKRYARRYGDERVAFGFDLTPLLSRFEEISETAEEVRQEERIYNRLRQSVSLMKRDLKGLVDYGRGIEPDLGLWDACDDLWVLVCRALRRALPLRDLEDWKDRLSDLLTQARDALGTKQTQEMSTSAVENEQHHQNSNKDSLESELCKENGKDEIVVPKPSPSGAADSGVLQEPPVPPVPIQLVLKAAPDIVPYVGGEIRTWRDLIGAAHDVHAMMGVSRDAWQEAMTTMGPANAAVTLLCMLQRITEIRSPGGYLRALSLKAADGKFSPGPMVMALLNSDNQKLAS